MGVIMVLLILTSLAVAALPSSSLPQLPLASHQPLLAEETEVAEKSVEAGDSAGEDVEKNYAKYVKLCTSLGITPITLGSGYTAPYANYGGYASSYYGNRYPSYNGYPSYTYPSGGYTYYRGNAVGRRNALETTEDTTEKDVENDYAEYLKLCSTLGLPAIPLSPSYSSPYTNYGGYGGSSNYGYGYAGPGGYNGYSGNYGYGGYPSYPYTANYVNPVYYRGNAAGRSTETETTEDSTKKDYDEYLKLCSTLGIPSTPLSGYSSPYISYGGSSYNGYPNYGSYNSGSSGYGYAYPVSYPAYGYPSNSGYGYL